MYAVDPKHKEEWEEMSDDDVLDTVLTRARGYPLLVSLSGGNPALQPLGGLISKGREADFTFALETQGTHAADWFRSLDHLVLSPKPPSSGMTFNEAKLRRCVEAAGGLTQVSLKIVVFGDEDYEFARRVSALHPELPIYLQAGTPQETLLPTFDESRDERAPLSLVRSVVLANMDWLASRVVRDNWFTARVSCQQHVLLWGTTRGR
jgi:7-carboxy-7-deazaguanine synthase